MNVEPNIQPHPIEPANASIRSGRIKQLSLQDLLGQEEHEPIWVLNTAERVDPKGGIVYLHINRGNGNQPIPCDAPRTWLATNLTAKAPRKDLLNSSVFMDALSKGLLTAIPAELAHAINSDENAAAERDRLAQAGAMVKAAQASRGLGRNVTVSVGANTRNDDNDADQPMPQLAQRRNQINSTTGAAPMQVVGAPQRQAMYQSFAEDTDSAQQRPVRATGVAIDESMLSLLDDEPVAEEVTETFRMFVGTLNSLPEPDAKKTVRLNLTRAKQEELQYLADNVKWASIQNFARMALQSFTDPSQS